MTDDHVKIPTTPFPVTVPAEALEPIPRRKLAHEVLDRLFARLRAGEFPVGSHLPSERELMQLYSVGRPAVREALQALERMGLVSIVHGERARVLPLSAQTVIAQVSDLAMHLLSSSHDLLEHLKEARCRFEVGMVRIAAERATKADIEVLRQALEAHRASLDDPSEFLRTDMAFHCAIAAISGNPIYMAVSQAMLDWLEKFHIELVRAPGAERVTFAEHEKIFERIAARDRDGAAKAIAAHLTRANKHYRLAEPPQPARAETSARAHGK
jgi:GntR family transcriptional regulator, sialic acid-inducible nan operon repressor